MGEFALEGAKSLDVTELPIEARIRERFNERFLGAVGLHRTVAVGEIAAEGPTLASAIDDAATNKNPEALGLIRVNVATAASEACFKDGYYSRTTSEICPDGEVRQFGLTQHEMHFNALTQRSGRSPLMEQFTLAEALTGYRIDEYRRNGLLDSHFVFVASCVPDNKGLAEEDLDYRGEGLFTSSMSFSLQATTVEGSKLVTESAFGSGTAASPDDTFEERQAQRFDLEAIGMVYEFLGHTPPKTALEFMQRPLLLSKADFPNGLLDVWRLCDIASDVILNRIEDRSPARYQEIIAESARKDAGLAGLCQKVEEGLLAAHGAFTRPEEANELLWELLREHASYESVENYDIDPLVFGWLASQYITDARIAAQQGNLGLRDELRDRAVEASVVSGCGGGACGLETLDPKTKDGAEMAASLEMKAGDKMVRDTKRACKKCHLVGGVVYVYNDAKVNKGCLHCKAVEVSSKQKPALQKTSRGKMALAA